MMVKNWAAVLLLWPNPGQMLAADSYSGTVLRQGVAFDERDQPNAIVLLLSEHGDKDFRVPFGEAARAGLTTEGRVRLISGSRVQLTCAKNADSGRCEVDSLRWVEKRVVPEGSTFIGTVKEMGIRFVEGHDEGFWITTAEHPQVEMLAQAGSTVSGFSGIPVAPQYDAVSFGVESMDGVIKLGAGDKIELTCVRRQPEPSCRVTSFRWLHKAPAKEEK